MTCLPTAASPPVIECTRPTLMTSCAPALWGAPSSTAIAITVTRNVLCIGFLPLTDLLPLAPGEFGGAAAGCSPSDARTQGRTDAVDFQRLLAGTDWPRGHSGRTIPSHVKPCPGGGLAEEFVAARQAWPPPPPRTWRTGRNWQPRN